MTGDPTFLQRLNDDDLEALAAEWAELCDPCDREGPGYCTCPPDTPRAVIARLITEVQRLRADVATWKGRCQPKWRGASS